MTNPSRATWLVLLFVLVAGAVGCAGSGSAAESEAAEEQAADAGDATKDDAAQPANERAKGKKNAKPDDEEKKEEAVPVEVATLARGPIESVLRFSTNLEAEASVQVFSQAKRLVTKLLVEEGKRVKRGDLLARLEDDEQQSALTKVQSQLDKAEREYERQQRLYQQELISEQVFNDATHELEQLRIGLDDARRELSYTEVRAPISGTVTARLVNLGDQVQIGQHLFDLVDFDSIVARVYVPEKHLADLRPGLAARISAQSLGTRPHDGRVERIAPVVDPRSGTVKVTVAVKGQQDLRPGLYVDVDLVMTTRSDAVLIPKRALVYDSDRTYVYRLGQERRVERVLVDPLLSDKQHVTPREGLAAGDRVVVAGQAGLKDKALVRLPEDPLEKPADKNNGTSRASL